MIEITKTQYFLIIEILKLNLNKEFYDAKLSRELGTSASLKTFRTVINLLRDHKIIQNTKMEGANIYYSIDKTKLINFIPETDIMKVSHNEFVLKHLGPRYKFWEYQ